MATPEQIRQRVEDADTARSVRRAAAAQQIGVLAQRRAGIVAQLEDVERELGDVLAEAQDVIGIDELAGFTDLKPADLSGWLAGRRPTRGRRRKSSTGTPREPNSRPVTSRNSTVTRTPTPREPAPAEDSDSTGQGVTAAP
ncbi:hypothetical protein [Saccharothrix syringae]|uniref:Uncharacterized protein n=1 Tax=Saccharothrix syringae TaxID=103733 RepID=A0A5Q0GYN0_SACSY|nr:hypothetical protein [Saccharothrix syringae]QFZ18492.1 hypothetical protein EKG83_14300 [Saccharothrix syringae]